MKQDSRTSSTPATGAARFRTSRRVLVSGAALVSSIVLATVSALGFGSRGIAALEAHHAPILTLERRAVPGHGPRLERWWIVTDRGDSVTALWRGAPPAARDPWTLVMLGGLQTGDRAVHVVPDDVSANVLAIDWPWTGPRRATAGELVAMLPAIRHALLRTPAALAAGVEAAARVGSSDPSRIALVGVSLGVPPALAAARLTERVAAVVLVDGCADLELLMRHQLESQIWPPWCASPIAWLGGRLVEPLEPTIHAPALRDRPVLVLNARHDERLPREAIERLHAALPHAEVRWRDGAHVRPRQTEAIAALASQGVEWLEERVD